jgi:hypothetical protein
MGFIFSKQEHVTMGGTGKTGLLGPQDQLILRELEKEIIQVLRKASELVKAGECKQTSLTWFGDKSDDWMKTLGTKLNKLASIINTKEILVTQPKLSERDLSENAAAYTPKDGWKPYTQMTEAQGQEFKIHLNSAWNQMPKFSERNKHVQSKFETLVHELTHLILNTEDIEPPYGDINCINKAKNSPRDAQNNAENWGFFVESMRFPLLNPKIASVNSKEWLDKTYRSNLHFRSGDLVNVDKALVAFEKDNNSVTRQNLKTTFNTWSGRNPSERMTRNVDKIIDRLKEYVDSL